MAVAVSRSLKGKESWEPGGGGAVKEPSLQRKLKIARRDDVIGFPQLSNPLCLSLSLTHTHTYTRVHAHTHTSTHNLTAPDSPVHTLSCIGEGRLLGPRATEAGKPAECVFRSVCLCWREQDCRCRSTCPRAATRCMHVCVCSFVGVCVCCYLCQVGRFIVFVSVHISVYRGVLGVYLHAGVNLLHCLSVSVVFIRLHVFLDCVTRLYMCGHPCRLWALASQPPALTGGSAPSPTP